jgi:uncharacterized protein (DUF2267 family)
METHTYSQWIEMLRALAPFADDESASRALVATLEALGTLLTRDERDSVANHLPLELRQPFLASRPELRGGADEFFRLVASKEGTRPGIAIEHAELVCRVFREALPFEARARLEHALPQLAQLFVAPGTFEPPLVSDDLSSGSH